MAICVLSMDLMFPSRVGAAAAARGVQVKTAMSTAALEDRLEEGHCRLLIIDLASNAADIAQLVPEIRAGRNPPETILAVGPHVQEDALRLAADAGCDLVMTNGQFHAQTDELLARYSSS